MDDPEPDANTIIFIAVFIFSLLCCFLVTMGTSALRAMNEKKTGDAADDGDKKAKKLMKLLDKRPKPTDTMNVCTTLSIMFALACALLLFLSKYAVLGLSIEAYATKSAFFFSVLLPSIIIILITTTLFSAFGILLPHRIGKQNPDKIAYSLANTMVFFKAILLPLTSITSGIARILVKIFGGNPHIEETQVTEDGILSMVDEGEESGVLEEIEKEMINNIFEFGDLTAGEVMTHRTYLTAVELNEDLSSVIEKAIEEGCSRLPVYEDELDNIRGILYVKDLLQYVGTKIPKNLNPGNLMREAMFIPESKKCRDLFSEMTEKHLQMVIVTDEYGGVAGIVTIEDLLESIVGSIQDEFDDEEEEIEQISENIFNIDGSSLVEEIEELLDIKFPEGEYDTIAGYLMSVLGRVPDKDEHPTIEYEGFSFTVTEMDERRIVHILVERLPEEETDTEEND